jgi:hypothetical protein
MADEPAGQTPVEIIPSKADTMSALGSAQAPFIVFNTAPAFGTTGGLGCVTLTAARLMVPESGQIARDHVAVAHLRMTLAGAVSLRDALNGLINIMAGPAPGEKTN